MERRDEEMLAQQQQACKAARTARGGWSLWFWGRRPPEAEMSEEQNNDGVEYGVSLDADNNSSACKDDIADPIVTAQQDDCSIRDLCEEDEEAGDKWDSVSAVGDVGGECRASRWQWLRDLAVKTVGAGAGLLQSIGEKKYHSLCEDKFHHGKVKVNRAKESLALQRGVIPTRAHSCGVRELECQDEMQADLAQDAICARAVELIYEADNCEMVHKMTAEFAECVFQPEDESVDEVQGEGARGLSSADPKWAIVRVKRGLLGGQSASESVMVVFRGTHSWEDTMHDLLCIPTEHASGVLLHRGVHLAIVRTAPTILKTLKRALQGRESAHVVLTGHSYGGALALALLLECLSGGEGQQDASVGGSLSAVTFGAPLVFGCGCSEASQRYLQRLNRLSRHYVHQGDVVPRLLGRQGQVILQAIGSSGLFAAGGVAGVAGGGANMCDKHSAEHVGHEKAEKAEKAGLRGVALSIASSIVGAYQPVGGFRFVYTVGAGATVGDGARHYIRIAQSEQETLRLLELEASLLWFTNLLIRDHSTEDYRSKVALGSTFVQVVTGTG